MMKKRQRAGQYPQDDDGVFSEGTVDDVLAEFGLIVPAEDTSIASTLAMSMRVI